jgi:hypothetical protein
MKNHSGGQFRLWRSRRSGKHAGAWVSPELPPVEGQTPSKRTVAGDAGCDGNKASEASEASEAGPRVLRVSGAAPGEAVAAAMQLAIGLLTASLDSPELEKQALPVLIPPNADGLGDLMAGLHVISELVMHELHEATGETPEAILQRLAILAEHRRGTPSAD